MTLSVLLPTRNGAPFLPDALEAVLSQDADFEFIVSDNANDDGTREILAERQDPRMRVIRHESVLSVDRNWTSALEASTGDYVLMLGDDDLLLPGSIQRLLRLLEDADHPDCLLMNAYSYVFPGAMSGVPESQYADPHFHYGSEFVPGADLPLEVRHSIVNDLFRFRVRVPLNMQTTVFSRSASKLIRGEVFPAPFPDHYAIASLLLRADRWVYSPEQLIVIGVTPKSFGHFVYSNQRVEGLEYLGIDADFAGQIPGDPLADAMHIWLQMLLEAYPELLGPTSIDRGAYVSRQLWSWIASWRAGDVTASTVARVAISLRAADYAALVKFVLRDPSDLKRAVVRLTGNAGEARWHGLQPVPQARDIGAFGRWITASAQD